MFKLSVLPHLIYGDVVYHAPHSIYKFSTSVVLPNRMEELESLQYSPALAVTVQLCKHVQEKLLSIIRPPPKFVSRIHGPKGLSILTQLRVGLSKLNFHKFKHNIR